MDRREPDRLETTDEPARTHGVPAGAARGGAHEPGADTTQPRGDATVAAPEPYAAAHADDVGADGAEIEGQGASGHAAAGHATAHDAAAVDGSAAHGGDGHGHGEGALGPVDWAAWGAGAAGVALGFVVAVCLLIAVNWIAV